MSDAPYKPDEAMARIEELVVTALGTRHPAIDDLAQIKFALRDAKRWRRLQTERYGGTLLLKDGLRLNGDEPESEWDAALSTQDQTN